MRRLILLVLAVALLGAACNRRPAEVDVPYSDGLVTLADRTVSLDIAATLAQERLGLAGRSSMEDNQGMLFLFDVPDFPEFWMKGMAFPLDIVWISGDEIVDISKNAAVEPGVADNDLKTYVSAKPADRVLELNAGWADRNGLKIGDKVEITRIIK